ncbi:uncharacterized protein EDB91DRAFT_1084229 [Suillus paluster]|uniref:uncharacterized protein n=1 Tax=Suillus paluster TaxID=48578 RepID=UPI001B8778F0|nr:uncharacterized protein EDB91DRAFT_1084229 [Suillus paluster]KAG1734091.1 hypothetical protein EDB91DRAFT_1084229 [Suillus paluster]
MNHVVRLKLEARSQTYLNVHLRQLEGSLAIKSLWSYVSDHHVLMTLDGAVKERYTEIPAGSMTHGRNDIQGQTSYPSRELRENCAKTPEDIGQDVRFTKGLSGTKGDSLWPFSDPVADMVRNLVKTRDGRFTLRDIGVGPCNGQRSPAAERQAEMLEVDRGADCFLLTASGDPVRFVIDDPGAKIVFRVVRGMVMMDTTNMGVESIAEYMLKLMSGYPGLSRDIILK